MAVCEPKPTEACLNSFSREEISNRIAEKLKTKFPHIFKGLSYMKILYFESLSDAGFRSCFDKKGNYHSYQHKGGFKYKLTIVIEDTNNFYSGKRRIDYAFGKINY